MTTFSTNAVPSRPAQPRNMTVPNGIGRQMRAVLRSGEFRILMAVLVVLVLWAVAIATFGYPALIVPALCLVPTMFAVLMLITVGK